MLAVEFGKRLVPLTYCLPSIYRISYRPSDMPLLKELAGLPSTRKTWQIRLAQEVRPATKISIIGAGNAMRGDDRIGLMVVDFLTGLLSGTDLLGRKVQIIKAFEVPENYTGQVRRFEPDLVLIIDAALEDQSPGTVFFVDPSAIASEDISTHKIPLSALVKYLEKELGCRVSILGIQPKSLDLGTHISARVYRAGKKLARVLSRSLKSGPLGT